MKTILSTPQAPAAIGPYSQGTAAGGFVFTSGQLGLDPATGAFAGADVESQARRSLENIKAILEAAGLSTADVVKTTVFLADMNDFGAVNAVYATYFPENPPARSCFQVAALPKGGLVEIEAVACR
ncbi:MAG TPA: RidA family protein [Oscillospiraceae bacterium]|nr:RidA family protein [Oscillospiraceae bacterium]